MCGLTTLNVSGSDDDLSVIRTREQTNCMCIISYVAAAIFAALAFNFQDSIRNDPMVVALLTFEVIKITLIALIVFFGFKEIKPIEN